MLAGLVAALASFSLAYYEARELQDDILRQIAMLDVSDTGQFSSLKPPRRDAENTISDPESRSRRHPSATKLKAGLVY